MSKPDTVGCNSELRLLYVTDVCCSSYGMLTDDRYVLCRLAAEFVSVIHETEIFVICRVHCLDYVRSM